MMNCRYRFDFKKKYMWHDLFTKWGYVFRMWGIGRTLAFMVRDTLNITPK